MSSTIYEAGTSVGDGSVPLNKNKRHSTKWSSVLFCVGAFLSSRDAAVRVLSAQVSLTAVFGMGTGVPSPPSTPTIQSEYPEN